MQKHTVLLVEPDDAVRQTVRRSLDRLGCSVVEATTGARALSLAEAEFPSFILMDLTLPDGDGVEFAQRLRRGESTSRIPVAVLAGEAVVGERAGIMAKVCSATIPKPVISARLEQDLQLLLSQARRRAYRRHRRVPVEIPARYRRPGEGKPEGPDGIGIVRSISEGGVSLELPDGVAAGSLLDLRLQVAGGEIVASGKVVYSRFRRDKDTEANSGCYVHGIQFTRLDEAALEQLRPLLKKPSSRRPQPAGTALQL
jgi:CheY-like chemotaxis protein